MVLEGAMRKAQPLGAAAAGADSEVQVGPHIRLRIGADCRAVRRPYLRPRAQSTTCSRVGSNIVAQPTEVAANHGGGVVQRGRGSLPGTNVQPVQEKGHTNSQTCHVGFFVVLRFSALMWVPMCVSVCLSLSWGRRTRPSAKKSTSTSFSNARRRSSEYPAPSSVVFAVC